jgi:ribosome-associated protein
MDATPVDIRTPDIRLDSLLKFAGAATTGGEAKLLIQSGNVRVNGRIERRRSHRVGPGDVVEVLAGGAEPALAFQVRATPA